MRTTTLDTISHRIFLECLVELGGLGGPQKWLLLPLAFSLWGSPGINSVSQAF